MSSLIVEVCEVKSVEPHTNADRMCIVTVKGWKVCAGRDPNTGKNQFEPGDKCIYLPPDCVLPVELSDRLGVTKYLGNGGRLKVANLRGAKSQGLIMGLDDPSLEVGTDVASLYGITKWEPPAKPERGHPGEPWGGAEADHPAFHRYYDMENLRNFPELFQDGEDVAVCEKIHGTNVRLGLVWEQDGTFTFAAGSHRVRRKPVTPYGKACIYWECMSDGIKQLLYYLADESDRQRNVVVYGELFGDVQDMRYGHASGQREFRAFDIAVNGLYVSHDAKTELFDSFGVPSVPLLYRGPFGFAKIEELCDGPTTLCDPENAGPFKGREGVVVTSAVERTASLGKRFFSRAQAKMVSFSYHNRKNGTEYH